MITSVIFIILCIACLLGILLYPKTDKKLNGVKIVIMGIMTIFCYQALLAGIYNKIGIRVGLLSTSVSMLIADLVLWIGMMRKKQVQKLFWRWGDIFSAIFLTAVIIGISFHLFSPNLRLSYANTDPANHFNYAMTVLKNGNLAYIYFSAYIDAIFIEVLSPLLTLAQYYKAFIFADIFMHILEILMFYVLVITISDRKVTRILAPLFAVMYFWGYPAYSYMTGGFVYWSTGVMILIYIVYALLLFERYPESRRLTVILLLLGCYANGVCNRLFIPVNYFAVFVALFIMLYSEKREKINKKKFWIITFGLTVCAGLAGVFLWNHAGGVIESVLEDIIKNGGIYRSMYSDLIYFIPAGILVFYFTLMRREYSKTLMVMYMCMIACTIGMYILWYNYLMSTYYYYKIYYNLWLFGWLSVVMALHILSEKKQLVSFFAYGGFIIYIGVMTLSHYDYRMWSHNVEYNGSYAPKELFSLYRFNMDSLLTDYEKYKISDPIMDVYSYTVESYGEEFIPILTTQSNLYFWYNGMKVQYPPEFGDELDQIVRNLDAYGVNKVLVIKSDEFYENYKDYFDLCQVLYESGEAAVYTFSGNSWSDILGIIPEYSEDKIELFSYVTEELSNESVPLMADKNAYFDFIMYYNLTGQELEEYYSWNYNPKENLENLNEHDVRYIVLLKNDEYYVTNAVYFDTQEIVYENAAGKIVKCIGNEWSTEYKE